MGSLNIVVIIIITNMFDTVVGIPAASATAVGSSSSVGQKGRSIMVSDSQRIEKLPEGIT